MKKISLILSFLFCYVISVFAENTFSIEDVKVAPGQDATVTVKLEVGTAFTHKYLALDLTPSEGLTLKASSCVAGSGVTGCTFTDRANGNLGIGVSDFSAETGTTVLFTFKVSAASTFTGGTLSVTKASIGDDAVADFSVNVTAVESTNRISIEDVKIVPGEDATVSVKLDLVTAIDGQDVTFKIAPSDGLSYDVANCKAAEGVDAKFKKLNTGSLKVTIDELTAEIGSTLLFTFKLSSTEAFTSGTLAVSDIEIGDDEFDDFNVTVSAAEAPEPTFINFSIDDVNVVPGQEATITVNINTDGSFKNKYIALDITPSEGLTFDQTSYVAGEGITPTFNLRNNGDLRVSVPNLSGKAGYTTLFTFKVATTESFTGGKLGICNASIGVDNITAFDVKVNALHSRTLATDHFGTICLPTAFTAEGATVYSATLSAANDEVVLEKVTTPEAGKSYIFKATANAQTFTMSGDAVAAPVNEGVLTGIFAETVLPMGSYIMQNSVFKKVTESSLALSAYKAYLTIPAGQTAKEMLNISFEGETTGIKAVNALNSLVNGEAKIYDLNGRQLPALRKGINIVNGVKVVVK